MTDKGITIYPEDLYKGRLLRYIRKSFDHPTKEEQEKIDEQGLFTKSEVNEILGEKE